MPLFMDVHRFDGEMPSDQDSPRHTAQISEAEKRELIERCTGAIVAVKGQNLRSVTESACAADNQRSTLRWRSRGLSTLGRPE